MSAHFRPPIIDSLKALWVALPIKAPAGEEDDPRERQMSILDTYCYVLREYSPEAVANVVDALREGKIKEASTRFCPTSPELARYVREEQSRLDAINRPRTISYAPERHIWKDWRVIQRQRANELAEQGFKLIADHIDHPTAVSMGKRRMLPAKSIWFWALYEIWGPVL